MGSADAGGKEGGSAFEDALRLHQRGRIADAEPIYEQIIVAQPRHPGALHLLGVIRQQQGRHEAALDLIGRAISANPAKAVYHNNYGAALHSLGRFEEALASFQRALSICAQYADALANLGMAQAALGQNEAAAMSFRSALAIEPSHCDALARLTRLRYEIPGVAPQARPCQREAMEANHQAGLPIYSDRPRGTPVRAVRQIAFGSRHCLADTAGGAAISTVEALHLLGTCGFTCRAFCGSWLDSQEDVRTALARRGTAYESYNFTSDGHFLQVLSTTCGGVRSTGGALPPSPDGAIPLDIAVVDDESPADLKAFCKAFDRFLHANRPEALLTYGGDPMSGTMARVAKSRDIPVVFWLRNFDYEGTEPFKSVDFVVVPSEFSRQFYWNTLGLACHRLPQVVDPRRVLADRQGRQHVTIVNPQTSKGVYIFARIAETLAKRRPDIPLLVVEGRALGKQLEQVGIDCSRLSSLSIIPNTNDPREFYRASKIVLMPSLWNESFGRVAAEAMTNGIPVLASNRGALPETIGDAGFLFDIPACYTPETRQLPSVEEVEPWVETIIRLWDDAAYYKHWSDAARERSKLWSPEHLAAIYRDFFGNLLPQPGPPLVPRA